MNNKYLYFSFWRVHLGTLSRTWHEEGIRGLYRGLGPTILGYLPTWAIYFTAYDYCKGRWGKEFGMYHFIIVLLNRRSLYGDELRNKEIKA